MRSDLVAYLVVGIVFILLILLPCWLWRGLVHESFSGT